MYTRNIGLLAYLIFIPAYADLSIPQIDLMTDKIKLNRVSVEKDLYKKIKSPYKNIVGAQDDKHTDTEMTKAKIFVLGAVINKKAFLNSTWVKKDDTIEGYNVIFVKEDSVRLRLNNDVIDISLKKNKQIIDISEEEK